MGRRRGPRRGRALIGQDARSMGGARSQAASHAGSEVELAIASLRAALLCSARETMADARCE